MLILKFMKTTLKLYTKKEYVITKKKKKKKESNFGMMRGNYLVKVGSYLLLSYLVGGFMGVMEWNGTQWIEQNGMIR